MGSECAVGSRVFQSVMSVRSATWAGSVARAGVGLDARLRAFAAAGGVRPDTYAGLGDATAHTMRCDGASVPFTARCSIQVHPDPIRLAGW
jgi:hypothetical protein